jgi:hypothetical protein
MLNVSDVHAWAESTFSTTPFPDVRNARLAVRMAEALVARPSPVVAKAFPDPALRQAAYDLLEHPRCDEQALEQACAVATAKVASAFPLVLVAVDGVTLTLKDPLDKRGTGSVGRRGKGARGLQVMDAVALTLQGHVLGLAGLHCWVRSHEREQKRSGQRPVEQRESFHWMPVRARLREVFDQHAPDTTRVLLHDSGADFWAVFLDLVSDRQDNEFTVVRAGQNRCAQATDRPHHDSYLWPLLQRAPKKMRKHVRLPAGHGRPSRRVLMELRHREVTLDLHLKPSSRHELKTVHAIYVREMGRLAAGQERQEMMLLTDYPVGSFNQAWEVLRWYLLRWRVEDQHKGWKKGGNDIEAMRLMKAKALRMWMVFHAAVSARALSLTHQSRDPEVSEQPAEKVFSQAELAGLRALWAKFNHVLPDQLTVKEAVYRVANLGGYDTRKDRKPGPLVIQRGLELVEVAASAVEGVQRLKRRPRKRRQN